MMERERDLREGKKTRKWRMKVCARQRDTLIFQTPGSRQ